MQKLKLIRRFLITMIIIILCFLFESSIFKKTDAIAVSPNLLLIATSAFGFMRGKNTGMVVGFFSGLLNDIFFGDILGFYALIFMLIGYCNGYFKRIFYDDDLKLPILLITSSDLIYGHVMYVFMFLLRRRMNYGVYLGNVIIPELIYTLIAAIVLYTIILKINKKLEDNEKRSASKFV